MSGGGVAVNRENLVQRLQSLNVSQQSIESTSKWCLFYIKDAKTVVNIWLEEFGRVPSERKVAFLYLTNHILQEGRKKGREYADEFARVLPRALGAISRGSDAKLKSAARRLVDIWDERKVYGSAHVRTLRDSLAGSGGGAGTKAEGAGVKAEGAGGGVGGGGGGGAVAASPGGAASDLDRRKLAAVGSLADVLFEAANAAARSAEWQTKCLAIKASASAPGAPPGEVASARATLGSALDALRAEAERRKKAVTYIRMHLSQQDDSLKRTEEAITALAAQKTALDERHAALQAEREEREARQAAEAAQAAAAAQAAQQQQHQQQQQQQQAAHAAAAAAAGMGPMGGMPGPEAFLGLPPGMHLLPPFGLPGLDPTAPPFGLPGLPPFPGLLGPPTHMGHLAPMPGAPHMPGMPGFGGHMGGPGGGGGGGGGGPDLAGALSALTASGFGGDAAAAAAAAGMMMAAAAATAANGGGGGGGGGQGLQATASGQHSLPPPQQQQQQQHAHAHSHPHAQQQQQHHQQQQQQHQQHSGVPDGSSAGPGPGSAAAAAAAPGEGAKGGGGGGGGGGLDLDSAGIDQLAAALVADSGQTAVLLANAFAAMSQEERDRLGADILGGGGAGGGGAPPDGGAGSAPQPQPQHSGGPYGFGGSPLGNGGDPLDAPYDPEFPD